ncbi:hypothetical protein [Natrinema altunense]|uniref:Uncharacterized protein n=1 Tax=Natrinema altunense TaxID=222984 RepID=A0A482Y3W5_9EURY|nr:hypothetical protein [Natrinema altunense]RZH68775.1 hypothetical protein ELS17_04750 [Natrinema altunense]
MPRRPENDADAEHVETKLTIPLDRPPEMVVNELIDGLRETAARNEARADRATVRDILDVTDALRRRKRGGRREQ